MLERVDQYNKSIWKERRSASTLKEPARDDCVAMFCFEDTIGGPPFSSTWLSMQRASQSAPVSANESPSHISVAPSDIPYAERLTDLSAYAPPIADGSYTLGSSASEDMTVDDSTSETIVHTASWISPDLSQIAPLSFSPLPSVDQQFQSGNPFLSPSPSLIIPAPPRDTHPTATQPSPQVWQPMAQRNEVNKENERPRAVPQVIEEPAPARTRRSSSIRRRSSSNNQRR